MHLSSDSEIYFKRDIPACVGWRLHLDCSDFTHVRILYMNIEPFFAVHKTKKICKIYCNLISKTITDPYGTLAVIGGTSWIPKQPGEITSNLDNSRSIMVTCYTYI